LPDNNALRAGRISNLIEQSPGLGVSPRRAQASGRALPGLRGDLTEQRQVVLSLRVPVEAEEEHPLPLAETEPSSLDRDLLGAGAEQRQQHPLAVGALPGDEPMSQKNPESRSLTRMSDDDAVAVTYAIPREAWPAATSRETSFVMSKTDKVGSAAATLCGIWTEVISPPPPVAAGSARPRGQL
jgi:hypothetical protein